ncbi:hypothetical protein, partial [Mycobacterium sp. 1245801.1]|uniref:hypothetical protein n=1 Tax=Mycobacterium sp. 1245801.1 TaxID=1834075 RepID=UPI003516837C
MRFDQGDVVGAQLHRFAVGRDDDPVLRQAVSPSDVGRGLPADQPRAGAVGDECGVQHVVEVGVHRDDRLQ